MIIIKRTHLRWASHSTGSCGGDRITVNTLYNIIYTIKIKMKMKKKKYAPTMVAAVAE